LRTELTEIQKQLVDLQKQLAVAVSANKQPPKETEANRLR